MGDFERLIIQTEMSDPDEHTSAIANDPTAISTGLLPTMTSRAQRTAMQAIWQSQH